jgi:hypothetical protein
VADNVVLLPGSGGDTISADQLGDSSKVQNVKVTFGAKDTMTQVQAGSPLPVDPSGVTSPISVASLPLPAGAATGAKQDTGNTSLSTIATNTPALGQALAAASVPVVLTVAQVATLTPLAAVQANAGTNLNTSLLALEAGGNLAAIKADVDKIPSQGQALSAASMPVVLPATQITTLTPPAAITGFALEAGHLATIDSHIPAQGQALAAASMPVVLTAAQVTTLTPPAAITGFALEAGHLATIDSHIPAQGQALAAASMPVVLTAAQVTTLTPPAAITGFALEAGHLATIDTSTAKIPSQGQALAAASMPVVLTAIQQAALTPPAAITGFALEAGHLATIDSHIPAQGQALAAASMPVVLTAAQITTLTPPTTVTVTQATGTNLHTVIDSGTTTVTQATGTNLHTVVDSGTIALSAGAAVIGHVIADTGSTTAVTGNVTVVQPTGTNLHTVIDSGTTTVTQATGTNLHTVIDSGTITAVTAITNPLPAGTNVLGHVITDTGSTTAVTGNVAVTGTFFQTTQPVSGTVTTNNTAVVNDADTNYTQASQAALTITSSGELKIKFNDEQRRNDEKMLLELQAQNMYQLMAGEMYGGGRYGFEIR